MRAPSIITLQSAIDAWLEVIERAKSKATLINYKSTAWVFRDSIQNELPPNSKISGLTEEHFGIFLTSLKYGSPVTEKHHATVMTLFFEFLSAKGIQKINMDAIRYMRRNETRKVPKRLRKMDFPAVAEIVSKVREIRPGRDICLARAKALVLLLSHSGLRAFEAIGLQVDNLDFKKLRGVVIGKGNKEARFIIDQDVVNGLREYHSLRKEKTNWLFISHSLRDRKIPRPIETDTARLDVMRVCDLLLSHAPEYKITPHQFRHYFATRIWRETGDIVQAQTALRHDSIGTTQGYVHTDMEDLERLEDSLIKARK